MPVAYLAKSSFPPCEAMMTQLPSSMTTHDLSHVPCWSDASHHDEFRRMPRRYFILPQICNFFKTCWIPIPCQLFCADGASFRTRLHTHRSNDDPTTIRTCPPSRRTAPDFVAFVDSFSFWLRRTTEPKWQPGQEDLSPEKAS